MTGSIAAVNRTLVTLIGLAVLLTGLVTIALSTGVAQPLLDRSGLAGSAAAPARTDPLRAVDAGPDLGGDGALVLVLLGALVLALLCVWWLVAQLPPRRTTRPLRLPTTGVPGSTTVDPSALADALEVELAALTGVTAVRVEVHGAAAEPRLTVRVTADEQADLGALTEAVHATVADDVGTALQTRIDRLSVLLDLSSPGRGSGSVISLGDDPAAVTAVEPDRRAEPILIPTSPATPVRMQPRRSLSGGR